ncbi:hypothetical protein [Streptomyces cucumeris]|uniref:hypothetical protein n=1 Tax=Streptomyces cucumeris TaxID=2962890 RepID=UPI0020C90BFC|nr:hypothetical protein [Streptomyces sp. NEAU-Y11]MCP9209631.1 hypothetical protein [Streptomyces sp. NEAU-Y11]
MHCIDCNKSPNEIPEYIEGARIEGVSPEEFVAADEGTYNRKNGHFLCTDDYIAREAKSGRRLVGLNGAQWTAP